MRSAWMDLPAHLRRMFASIHYGHQTYMRLASSPSCLHDPAGRELFLRVAPISRRFFRALQTVRLGRPAVILSMPNIGSVAGRCDTYKGPAKENRLTVPARASDQDPGTGDRWRLPSHPSFAPSIAILPEHSSIDFRTQPRRDRAPVGTRGVPSRNRHERRAGRSPQEMLDRTSPPVAALPARLRHRQRVHKRDEPRRHHPCEAVCHRAPKNPAISSIESCRFAAGGTGAAGFPVERPGAGAGGSRAAEAFDGEALGVSS
jgi:hypothetical protein